MSSTVAENAARRVAARRRQGGFSLLGLALTLALTSMIAIWASSQLVQRIEDAAARSTGVWLTQVRQATAGVLEQHFAALAKGEPLQSEAGVPLFADPYAPTVAELRASAHLPADFPERASMGFAARINVARSEACPGERCRIDALVYSANPVLKVGTHAPDLIGIAAVIDAAQGYGGAVWPEAPGQVRGAAFSFPNPLVAGAPMLSAGTVALWAGVGAQPEAAPPPVMPDLSAYVKIGDPRDPMLGGALTVASSISAGAYLSVGARAVARQPCHVAAGTMASTHEGELLTCQFGLWQRASSGFGGAYSVNYPLGCRHYTGVSTANPLTGQCSCPPGFAAVIVSAGGKWTETEGWTTGYVCVR
ncbi:MULTISPECIES: prepilin [Achromobacter]|uniref:Prepilin n=1 Tax=Achromobacter spanius TaxID=217203 RepID=A0ABY8GTZ7_9BURK|nr:MULTISPECIES: prepilin [Achromobacter]WAI82407.1 prepilin [Achromobacter spanius]WEX92494.1 prepilin [Achromobacter sp. SS2-2022]WFP08353.1 prepilin [Achromobacter spanius]